jgi:DNA-binding transcriptional LysR family regulator
MRVEHVRAFVALAEELNFRRAAARLFVSQPALTAQLHQLERDLGVTLFDRGPGGTRLTDRGASLLPAAREVLRSTEHLSDLAGGGWPAWRHQRVRVGLGPDGIGPATWLALRTLTSIRPDLELTVAPLVFRTALPALDGGDVDALLLHGPVDEVGPRRVVTVGWVPVGVLMPRHHWLAHRADVDLDAVLPLLRALPPRQMGEAFTQFWFLPDRLRSPPPAVQMASERSPAMASEAARTGLVGLWPADIVVPPASGAVVRPLADPAWAPLQVVVRLGWPLADELVAATRDAVRATAPLTGTALARPDQES